MSVQTEIERIKANVSDSFSAIKNYGMEVTVTEKSDSLPTAIEDAFDDVNALLDQINGNSDAGSDDTGGDTGGDSGDSGDTGDTGSTSNLPKAEEAKF